MTVAEVERLHRTLSRLENELDGYKAEIIGGNIVMGPVRPHHGETIRLLGNALEAQLPADWHAVVDVAFVFADDTELCPDLAVIPRSEADRNLSSYACDLIEIAVEVVSPSSVDNDYKEKVRRYASRGVPVYLIFDPYAAHCVAMWEPDGEEYASRVTTHYGSPVQVSTPLGDLSLDTKPLPVDPSTTRGPRPPAAPAP